MKKILLILTLLFSVVAGAMAQNDAIYVYRNDGVINAFLKSDIDSIRYSKVDLDSIDHPNYVVQEVWAVDSVYRIPLAVVDSVRFVTPPTVYKRGVIDMSESLVDYIIGAEGLTLKLMTSTPSELLPRQGDKLVLLDGCDAIPNGFSGKVISVNTSGSSCIEVVCEKTYVEDIFDTFYSVQTVCGYVDDSVEEGENSANRVVYNPKDKTFRLGSLKSSISNELSQAIVPNGDLALKGGASLTVALEPTFRIHTFLAIGDGQGLYFSSSITGNLSVSSELSIYGGLEWQHEFINPVFSAPIPCTADLVNFYLNPGLFIRAGAVVTSTISNTKDYSFCMAYDYSSKGENMIQPMLRSHQLSSSTDVTGSIDGSLAVGTYFETGFNIASREFMKLCLRCEYGWEAKGSYVLLNSDIKNAEKETKLYERLKASKFEFGPFINASLVAGVSGSSAGATLQSSGDFWQWDLVPTFEKTTLSHSSKGQSYAEAYSEMSGTCLFPVSVGYKLYDENMNELSDYNAPSTFRKGLEALTHTFTSLDAGHKYTIYPKVRLFGHDILASPKAEITTALPKVTHFEQTKSSYSPKAEYVSGGQNYKYKFDVATTVEIESRDGVYDWGYAYESSDGKITHISLKNFSSPYTDTRYAYYRNEPSSSVRLYGYVRYSGDGEYYYDEPQDFTLKHEEEGNVLLCDSIITYNVDGSFRSRQINNFDENGNWIGVAYYRWQDGQWVGYQKQEWTNDANGYPTTEYLYRWLDGQWGDDHRYEYTYDANGNRTNIIFYHLENGQWIKSGIGEYTYDANNNETSYVFYSMQSSDSDFKYEYTYDENGNYTRSFYIREDGQWVKREDLKYELAYDANGNMTSYATHFGEDGQWVSQHKFESTYDANGNQTSYANYHWEDGQWVGESKGEQNFDETGKMTGGVYYIWQDGQWQLDSYSENFYSMHFCKNIDAASRAPLHEDSRLVKRTERLMNLRPTGSTAMSPYDYQDLPINNHRQTPPRPMKHSQ